MASQVWGGGGGHGGANLKRPAALRAASGWRTTCRAAVEPDRRGLTGLNTAVWAVTGGVNHIRRAWRETDGHNYTLPPIRHFVHCLINVWRA